MTNSLKFQYFFKKAKSLYYFQTRFLHIVLTMDCKAFSVLSVSRERDRGMKKIQEKIRHSPLTICFPEYQGKKLLSLMLHFKSPLLIYTYDSYVTQQNDRPCFVTLK